MKHSEVAKDFGNGCTTGSGSRMFIEGDTVYSHGWHFPIAKRLNEHGVGYLFNSGEYSSSTSKHKRYILNELRGTVLHICNCDLGRAECQLRMNNHEIAELRCKIKKARSRREAYEDRVAWLIEQNELLKLFAIVSEL